MQILMLLLLGIMLLPHPASAWFIDDFILPETSVSSTTETDRIDPVPGGVAVDHNAEKAAIEIAGAASLSAEAETEADADEVEAATAATPSATPEAELEATDQNVVESLNETTETEAVVAEGAAVPATATAPPDIALPNIAPDIASAEAASDESSADPATSETAEAEAVSIETGTEPDAIELPSVQIGTSADLLPSAIAGSEPSQDLNQRSRVPENNFYEDPIMGMTFIFVEGGCFMMGSRDCGTLADCPPDEEPSHEVCLDDYWLGSREVSQAEWQQVMGNNPSQFPGRDRPVEQVSWNDVQAFLFKLNNLEDNRYRLPTEAEWEYAARSGSKAENWAGTDSMTSLGEYAWYAGNSGDLTHPVGQKRPNSLGFYDMSGNVWEWCLDGYSNSYYAKSPRDNPQGMEDSIYRVQRGGSWLDTPQDLRAAHRVWSRPDYRTNFIGFRLMLPAN